MTTTLFDEIMAEVRSLPVVTHAEPKRVLEAVDFSISLINSRGPTVSELVKELSAKFGLEIRLMITDVFEMLRTYRGDSNVSDFAECELTHEKIAAALNNDTKPRNPMESTLDELFHQSVENSAPAKLIDAVRFVSHLREYSAFNNMLVYLQRPNARYWATRTVWKKKFHRHVLPAAVPIVILRPQGPVMLVYEVEDTFGKDVPPGILNSTLADGDLDPAIYHKTLENCGRLGIRVRDVELRPGHAGTAIRKGTSKDAKLTIEINQALDLRAKFATICHEIAHIYLGHLGSDPFGKEWFSRSGLNRAQTELEAEAVSYLVCSRAGLSARSADYLSGYVKDPADIKQISVEQIMKITGLVERMGRENIYPKPEKKG